MLRWVVRQAADHSSSDPLSMPCTRPQPRRTARPVTDKSKVLFEHFGAQPLQMLYPRGVYGGPRVELWALPTGAQAVAESLAFSADHVQRIGAALAGDRPDWTLVVFVVALCRIMNHM
jgi:hypothetical protein